MALAGPRDASTAFVRNGELKVIDGRGNTWTYDASVTTDANGDEIVAPTGFSEAELGKGDTLLVVDESDTAWTYNLNQGEWSKGLSIEDHLPGEDEKTTEPWKQGHNVSTKAPEPEAGPAKKKAA